MRISDNHGCRFTSTFLVSSKEENTKFTFDIACVASVSVLFPSKDRSRFISRAAKTENLVPRSFFAPKQHGNVWLSFHFSRGQNRESRSSVFLCSETARKRLLRRLRLTARAIRQISSEKMYRIRRKTRLTVLLLTALVSHLTVERSFWQIPRTSAWFDLRYSTYSDDQWYASFRVSKNTFQFLLPTPL